MTDKNIQIKDQQGNLLFPKTKAAVVYNNSNESLGTVAAGAQVNVIETVKVNGTALSVTDKAVDVTIPDAAEYTIVKAETAETGFLSTYNLTKDGTVVGASINIPKDFLVKSGSVKVCEEDDNPVEGYKKGDKYIDFVINVKEGTATDEHMYILVKDLVDVYTAGSGINISGNQISVDSTVVALQSDLPTKLSDLTDDSATTPIAQANTLTDLTASVAELNYVKGVTSAVQTQLDNKVAKNADITAGTHTKITYDAKGLVTAGADLAEADIPELHLAKVTDVTATAAEVNVLDGIEATTAELNYVKGVTSSIQDQLNGKQASLTTDQLAAVNSGITSTKVSTYDGYATTIEGKADKATTLSGYGITDAYTKTEIDGMALLTYVEITE